MVPKKPHLSADEQRRTDAQNQAVAILHTLLGYLHVDDAYYLSEEKIMGPVMPYDRPLLTVQLSADIPHHLFQCITDWDADADPDLDGSDNGEREECTDIEAVNYHG